MTEGQRRMEEAIAEYMSAHAALSDHLQRAISGGGIADALLDEAWVAKLEELEAALMKASTAQITALRVVLAERAISAEPE